MDWIRRNWPDLLIGIALLAVIAGIIATLLTGGSFFPLGGSGGSGSDQQQTVDRPFGNGDPGEIGGTVGQAGDDDSAGTTGNSSSGSGDGTSDIATGADDGFTVGPIAGEPVDAGEAGAGVEVTALPLPGSEGGETQSNQQAAAAAASEGAGSAGADASGAGQAGSTTAAATAGAASAGAAPAVDEGEYRISVGAFSSDENAQAQAQRFRDAGYPVFTGTQGNLAIVLVGPYDDLSQAESVAGRIAGGGFGIEPLIYRFQPDDESSASTGQAPSSATASATSSTDSATSTQSSSASSTAPAPSPTAAGAGSARYVQVGAYGNAPTAQPQKQRLEGLGFRVTEREEGDLIKLLVGPFEGESLETARGLLVEQGIDHFVR